MWVFTINAQYMANKVLYSRVYSELYDITALYIVKKFMLCSALSIHIDQRVIKPKGFA